MKVFWSWQSDTPEDANKHFVRAALQEAVELVANDLGLSEAERPEVDHDTKNEPGLVEIVATIFKKIEGAAVFVGDVTPIATSGKGKLVPNPNVMIELGYALKTLGHERIVLVSNSALGGRPEDLPFDLRHRRGPITYTLPSNAAKDNRINVKKKLAADLASALRANLGSVLTRSDAEIEFDLYSVDGDDRSTWMKPGEPIEHRDYFNGAGSHSWPVASGPRSYIRVAPAAWSGKKPSRLEIQNAPPDKKLSLLGSWSNGDGGANELGVVSVGYNSSREAISATQWFDKTGEVWSFSTAIAAMSNGDTYIGQYRVLKDWANHLPKTLKFLTDFGALGPFRVELGVEGLMNLVWSGDPFIRSLALENRVGIVRTAREWNVKAQLEFVTECYNELCDAFNQPRLTAEAVAALLPNVPG